MADLTLSDISDALSLVYRDKIQNQINRNVVLLNLLSIKQDGGKVANWTAKFTGRTNAAGYAEGADMGASDFDFELREDAVLNWGQYRKGAKVTGLAQATHATNYNPESVAEFGGSDVFADEIKDAAHRLALGINVDLYAGDGSASNPLVGLDAVVATGDTYAGISGASIPEHNGTVQTFTLASLSLSKLRTFHTAIYEASGEPPEFCMMPSVIFDAVGDLFGDERRFLTDINTFTRGDIRLRGGFKAIEVDGIPYVRDRHATTSTIYGLNSRHLVIKEVPGFTSPLGYERFASIMQRITSERPPEEAFGEMMANNAGLTPYVDILSRTGDAQKAQVKSYLQLCCTRRNSTGRIDLT